jgi:hypothetical protein
VAGAILARARAAPDRYWKELRYCMAVIHHTTLTPGKLDLLASWLPSRPWYTDSGQPPQLAKAGGFRLDDPAGEVGIEFMVVTDETGTQPASYHVPLTYRAAPLAGAEHALIGQAEHGVLGPRWVYDGALDPVLMTQLAALISGTAQAQAQSASHTPDPSVARHFAGPAVGTADLRIVRRLKPFGPESTSGRDGTRGYVEAGWQLPDGTTVRGLLVVVPDAAAAGTADAGTAAAGTAAGGTAAAGAA